MSLTLEQELKKYIRQNETIKYNNKKIIKFTNRVIKRIVDYFKKMIPELSHVQIKNQSDIEKVLETIIETHSIYMTQIQGRIDHFFGKRKEEMQGQDINLASISEHTVEFIDKYEKVSIQNKKYEKQFAQISQKIMAYEQTISEYSLIIQKLEYELEDKSYTCSRLLIKGQLEDVELEKLKKNEFRWKSRYNIIDEQLKEIKKNVEQNDQSMKDSILSNFKK